MTCFLSQDVKYTQMFKDRIDAGRLLAKKLERFKGIPVVVFALPRGGVVVAAEIAESLNAPLDLLITRKIRHPSISEYAIGAVSENGYPLVDRHAAQDVSEEYLQQEIEYQKKEAHRRRQLYTTGRQSVSVLDKIAIIVDDGIATGLTMKVAVQELKMHHKPKKIVVVVPVIPKETMQELEAKGVEVVSAESPEEFLGSVGSYYENFPQVSDEEVVEILNKF